MAEPSEELQPEPEDGEGGAVKSFLEHLEDLRWTIIKSAAATLAGMMVCLFAVNHLVAILTWPLKRAQHRHIVFMPEDTNTVLHLRLGSTPLQSIELTTNRIGPFNLGTNRQITMQLEPVTVGTNTFLSMRMAPSDPDEGASGPQLVYMDPSASFMSAVHLAFFGGLMLASPFVLYFIGEFVMPALKIIEKKYFLRAFCFGTVLFLGGVSVAYFVVMPPALKFAEQFAQVMGISSQIWKAEDYFSFVVKFMLGMGLGFELPVVLLALVKIGLLNYGKLKAMRRYMIVGNLVLGALLTTPEVFTQIIMAVALQLLFEVAVWIAWYWERQEKQREAKKAAINV
ncbi:MAG: twin-arginine translocase subunit TatC [Verrucomicrobiota bacterium]|jgi:sec-independent protein translocase protein TatC